MYSIVIPACETNDKCKDLLDNLLHSLVWGYYHVNNKIIVCYDNCSPEFREYFQKEFEFIIPLVHKGPNLNFCKNANKGLRHAHKNYPESEGVLLLNQDTVLPSESFLKKMFNKGIATPNATHVDGVPWSKFQFLNKQNSPGCPCNQKPDSQKVEDVQKFAAFCMWISREALNTLGYLDENTFIASFEDDDYALRACLAKLPCQRFPIYIHHELKNRDPAKGEQISTTGSYDLNQLGNHMMRFMHKWKIPGNIPHEQFPQFVFDHWQGIPALKVH